MEHLNTYWIIFGLFMLRIGVPVMLLLTLGTILEKWQRRRSDEFRRQKETQRAI
jgi:hypothetical protein